MLKNKILLNNEEKWNEPIDLSRDKIEGAINLAVKQVEKNMEYFGDSFQSPATHDDFYKKMDNIEWTNGFWTGQVWLAYEITKNEKFRDLALKHIESFKHRIENKIEVNHHDMGFLYSLSCVAGWKIDKNLDGKQAALDAADHLLTRYQPKGEFIQAWGDKGAKDNYRLIIDCLLNIPLLFWASEETKDETIREKSLKHYRTSLDNIIREDGSTHHTYFFDNETGKPLHGKTRQGYSDDSNWARGQAWVIYGIPLTLKYNKDLIVQDQWIFDSVLNVMLNKLPEDNVPYWDLIFKEGTEQSRDSSSAAIVVCGILEMVKLIEDCSTRKRYLNIVRRIANSLIDHYANKNIEPGRALLLHGVYSYHSTRGNKGWDEGNIWGDYFYLEMLYRLKNINWNEYW